MQVMRAALVFTGMIAVCCFAVEAQAGGKSSARDRDMAQFANEVASKIVYRTGTDISVSARDCRMRIEYGKLQVSFDLPLQGTTAAETETEDGIILNNKLMTRTLKDRNPEAFENLVLRFSRSDIKQIKKAFDRAITVCGGSGPSMAAVR